MLTITGEVRKVLDDAYTDKKSGEVHPQAIVVIEPKTQAQNYEIQLTRAQCKAGARSHWEKLIGQQATIEVTLYVNYDYRFHKFTAHGKGLPAPHSN